MDRFNTTTQCLSASFAKPAYFSVDFTNPYGQQVGSHTFRCYLYTVYNVYML